MSVTLTFDCDRDGCARTDAVDVYEPSRVLSAYLPEGWGASRRTLDSPYLWTCPSCRAKRDAEPPADSAIRASERGYVGK